MKDPQFCFGLGSRSALKRHISGKIDDHEIQTPSTYSYTTPSELIIHASVVAWRYNYTDLSYALRVKHRMEPSTLVYRTLALGLALRVREIQRGR
jgi:hypothetical protein